MTDARWQWFPAAVYIQADQSWHLATFFYESVWCLGIAVFLIVWEKRGRKKQRSEVFWWYVLLYGLERAVVEGLRTDSLHARRCARLSGALRAPGGGRRRGAVRAGRAPQEIALLMIL